MPAVVRLIAPPARSVPDLDCDVVDWDRAQRAMRLMLAHHAMEDGQVWVAEREDGTLLAVAVWLPPAAGSEPPDQRFGSLLSRELSLGPQIRPFLSAGLRGAGPEESQWTVAVVGALDDTSAWDHIVAAELLAPGLRAVDEQGGAAVALTVSARHSDQLRPLGFRRPRAVRLTPGGGGNGSGGGSVWLTTRQPAGTAQESAAPGYYRSHLGSMAA